MLYWEECKHRVDDLTKKIYRYYNKRLPIPFTYFEDNSDTMESLTKASPFSFIVKQWITNITSIQIPLILDLEQNPIIKDYHFLIMKNKTITARIIEEVKWLATNSG